MCYCLQSDRSLLAVVGSVAFWVMTSGQLAAEWCLYLLVYATPLYLYDVSHVSRRNYIVSGTCLADSFCANLDSW